MNKHFTRADVEERAFIDLESALKSILSRSTEEIKFLLNSGGIATSDYKDIDEIALVIAKLAFERAAPAFLTPSHKFSSKKMQRDYKNLQHF